MILVDDVRRWESTRRWQPEYLKAVVGNREVAVRETNGPPRNIFQNLAEGGLISFSDYLDWVLQASEVLSQVVRGRTEIADLTRAICESKLECAYYLDIKLEELSQSLLKDAPIPDWYGKAPLDINLWCGVLGTSSGLHCDVTPNCNVQVLGRKHFILFAPAQHRLVYKVPSITHCRFDPNLPDYDRFPLARQACGWQCTLDPGESVYIPVGWFHQVTVASDWAVNVNFFWPRPFPQGLAIPSLWRFLLRRGLARVRGTVKRKVRTGEPARQDRPVPQPGRAA
jgi:hypothetical protein